MTTLSQLKTSVDAWLIRDDVAVTGSDFAQILLNAESEISRAYRLVVQEATVTLNFTGRSADLPADFLEVRNPFIDDNVRRFEYQTPQAIRENSAWENGRVGSFYTLEGGGKDVGSVGDDRVQMTIAGPASASSPLDVDVNYWRKIPALVNDPDTNWLLQNHFDVYLFETLYQAAIYIQETEMAKGYYLMLDNPVEVPGQPLGIRQRQARHENRKRYGAMPKQAYGNPRGVV